jgi:hypothetical protein
MKWKKDIIKTENANKTLVEKSKTLHTVNYTRKRTPLSILHPLLFTLNEPPRSIFFIGKRNTYIIDKNILKNYLVGLKEKNPDFFEKLKTYEPSGQNPLDPLETLPNITEDAHKIIDEVSENKEGGKKKKNTRRRRSKRRK